MTIASDVPTFPTLMVNWGMEKKIFTRAYLKKCISGTLFLTGIATNSTICHFSCPQQKCDTMVGRDVWKDDQINKTLPQKDGWPSTLHPWWALNCSCRDWSDHQCSPSLVRLDRGHRRATETYTSAMRKATAEPTWASHLSLSTLMKTSRFTPAQAARRVKHLKNVLNHFWGCWRQEYLLELRECHRCSRGKESASTVEVGDIVLMYDDALPRSFWKVAKFLELITGWDGKLRGTMVKVLAKSGGTTTLRHALQLIYPLEIKCRDQYEQGRESVEQLATIKWRNHLLYAYSDELQQKPEIGWKPVWLSSRTLINWLSLLTTYYSGQWGECKELNTHLLCNHFLRYVITSCYAVYTLMYMIHHIVWVCTDWI